MYTNVRTIVSFYCVKFIKSLCKSWDIVVNNKKF